MLNNIRINRKFWINFVFFIGAAFILVFLFKKYRVAPDFPLADLQLATLEGQPVPLSQFKGKTLVINFWATWCGDCRGEMPSIEKTRLLLEKENVVFVCVSDEPPERIKAFLDGKNYGMTFLVCSKTLKELGINTLPTTYIIDNGGLVQDTEVGARDWSSEGMLRKIRQ